MLSNIKALAVALAAALLASAVVAFMARRLRAVEEERDRQAGLARSYALEAAGARGDARVYAMTVEELEASRDTLMARLDSIREAAGVRDRRLRAVAWRETVVERVDTVWLADSIFVSDMDTTISDGWVSARLSVVAPDKVGLDVSVRNETSLIVSSRRETVRPPRRFPLFRLFQRKRTVVEVTAVEGNPHCVEKSRRYVEIID